VNTHCLIFGAVNLKEDEIKGKRVLEIGACDVNGSLRPIIESRSPKEYIGIDIGPGNGIDVVLDVKDIVKRFGENSFDVIVSTELLEHVRDWRTAIHNIKRACKPGGVILITTRSIGFPYHGYPYDFWRYEIDDMRTIFGDCEVVNIQRDPEIGVHAKIIKPEGFTEKDLKDHALYSIVTRRRVRDLKEEAFRTLYFYRILFRDRIKKASVAVQRFFNKRKQEGGC
jgi:SAM-dependent methyltransferase